MAIEIVGKDAPQAFHETMWFMRVAAEEEQTRLGAAFVLPQPFMLTLYNPTHRVIGCPIRNANPFFHVMEVVWMFAGRREVNWIGQFNKNMHRYADREIIHGAYGYRWLRLWGNQVIRVVELLKKEPTSRQAVIAMWDPSTDYIDTWSDRPCNTHIYFRVVHGKLDMTVCNRSNDVVWGMFGANVVHMTYLQELISIATGIPIGEYHVFTNNLHFYQDVYPNGHDIWTNLMEGPNPYPCETFPILDEPDAYMNFFEQCEWFVRGKMEYVKLPWLTQVAGPLHDAYLAQTLEGRLAHARLVEDKVWRQNAIEWLERNHGGKEFSNSRP